MMGGSDARTLVLVGKTGNGKSATGNSILGKKMFKSERSLSGVTTTCVLKTNVMKDGQMLRVIDTPGLFDSSVDFGTIGKEIVSCIKMAAGGIHAVLVVLSVLNRFSEDEKVAISSLKDLFGGKICDYMIVVFTGGDALEEDGKTLEGFLRDCPQALKEVLSLCGNRCILFGNKMKDESKRANQVQKLLSLVNMMLKKNDGEPYTNEVHDTEWKCEVKLKEMKLKFDRQLFEERIARLKVEENAEAARKKAEEAISRLRVELEKAKERELELCNLSSTRMLKQQETREMLQQQENHLKLQLVKTQRMLKLQEQDLSKAIEEQSSSVCVIL